MSRRIINIGGSFLSLDPDALAFITNWEANTGVTMQQRQRDAVIELYAGLKGQNTVNSTDFWTIATTNNAKIFPLVPLTDTAANALSYELEMVSNGVLKGSYVGFSSGDFTQFGVIGGTGKYFNPFVNIPNDFDITNFLIGTYCRTNSGDSTLDWGQNGRYYSFRRLATNVLRFRMSNTGDINQTNNDSSGLISEQAIGTTKRSMRNTAFLGSNAQANDPAAASGLLFHAYNLDSPSSFSTRQLCTYYVGMNGFSLQSILNDWYELWQRYQTNVIDGGRQV
jgi:hypothetical protein